MKRNDFLKLLAAAPAAYVGMKLPDLQKITSDFDATDRMPVLFIGHGSPMNAMYDNGFTQTLTNTGSKLQKPTAIMVVSAHWETRGTFVSANPAPKTIYDFGGFPDEMYKMKYEPSGHPALAKEVADLGINYHIQQDHAMGLDHGAWTVLKHMYPKQDIPVFQLSIDYTKPASYHFELATALKKMRERGVLILASGNIVHNLRRVDFQNLDAKPFDWAAEFDEIAKDKLVNQDFQALVNYQQLGPSAQMAIPSPDHYLPLIYTIGMAEKTENVSFIYEGMQHGSISMRCLQFG
jgi:4,5-DOPA dioxygenase extradiol